MPQENEIIQLVANSLKFEKEFQLFFTKECFLEYPDVERLECSFAADDGTFHLEMLTGNPLFDNLLAAIAKLKEIADSTPLNTPEKVTFGWIRLLSCWMNDAKLSVSADIPHCRHRSMGQDRADELIALGKQLLQQRPDSLVHLLSLQNSNISTSLSELSASNECIKRNEVQCQGSILVRWWSFLYNAMIADRQKLSDWIREMKKLSDECERILRGDENKLTKDPKAFIPFYECRDQAELLLRNLDDLFLTPRNELIEQCSFVLTICQEVIYTRSSFAAMQAYVKYKYSDDTAVIDKRLLLLDALAERTEIARHAVPASVSTETQSSKNTNGNAREQCRHALRDVLKEALSCARISQKDADALCKRKAWEIENALHDYCDSDQSNIDYLEKGRSIKNGLKDIGNLQLTLAVLSGAMTAGQLVTMSSGELANPLTQKIMEQQKQKERQSHILTPQHKTTLDSKMSATQGPQNATGNKNVNQAMLGTKLQIRLLQNEKTAQVRKTHATEQDVDSKYISSSCDKVSQQSLVTLAKSSVGDLMKVMIETKNDASADIAYRKSSMIKARNGVDAVAASAPPPPPSLNPLSKTLAKHSVSNNASMESKIKKDPPTAIDTSDTDESVFTLRVHGKRKEFKHRIRVQLNGLSIGHKLLPDVLCQCGFPSYDEFNSFVKQKRDTGRCPELNFKVFPASGEAIDQLTDITEYIDRNNKVVVLASKCQDCYNNASACSECQELPCTKSYILTPKFQQLFADIYNFADQRSTFIFTFQAVVKH